MKSSKIINRISWHKGTEQSFKDEIENYIHSKESLLTLEEVDNDALKNLIDIVNDAGVTIEEIKNLVNNWINEIFFSKRDNTTTSQ